MNATEHEVKHLSEKFVTHSNQYSVHKAIKYNAIFYFSIRLYLLQLEMKSFIQLQIIQ